MKEIVDKIREQVNKKEIDWEWIEEYDSANMFAAYYLLAECACR